jgi:hypothetical protein
VLICMSSQRQAVRDGDMARTISRWVCSSRSSAASACTDQAGIVTSPDRTTNGGNGCENGITAEAVPSAGAQGFARTCSRLRRSACSCALTFDMAVCTVLLEYSLARAPVEPEASGSDSGAGAAAAAVAVTGRCGSSLPVSAGNSHWLLPV